MSSLECCGVLFVVSFTFLMIVILLAPFAASSGMVIMLTGNAILRAAGHEGYASDAYAAVVGAIGGLISYGIFFLCFTIIVLGLGLEFGSDAETWDDLSMDECCCGCLWNTFCWVMFAILTSATGAAALWPTRDLLQATLGDPLSIRHAVAAGVLGATIYVPVVIPWLGVVFYMAIRAQGALSGSRYSRL